MNTRDSSETPKNKEKNTNFAAPESLRILEAVLFASDDILTPAKLKTILPDNPDARIIRKMVNDINVQLQKGRHPFEIVELGGGYQFRTISYYQPWVQQLFKEKSAKKLSIQALECLAIISYKQPLSKSQIESIRGVLSDGSIKTLLERHLITITGRSEKAGRPLLYGTSPEFLKYFGINKISDLPKIDEFEAIAKEKMEEYSNEELEDAGVSTTDETTVKEHEKQKSTEEQPKNESNKNNSETASDNKPIEQNTKDESSIQIEPDENNLENSDKNSLSDSTESKNNSQPKKESDNSLQNTTNQEDKHVSENNKNN